MSSLRIAVITDDRFFCEAFLHLLRECPELEVAAFGDDIALPVLRADHHVVILDGRVRDALALCEAVCADGGPSVIFVAAPEDDEWICRALDAGARGILTKTSHVDDTVKAIHVVREGGIWGRRRWLYAWARDWKATRSVVPPVDRLDARLSRREREVFHGAAMGAGNKELADRLAISEATVKTHLTRIFQKLGVSGRAELAATYCGLSRPSISQSSYDQRRTFGRASRSRIPPSAN